MSIQSLQERAPSVPILLVDDNASKRVALRAALQPLGCRVVEADSGAAALRHLTEEDFAVILLDVRMPIMDGFETAALVRQRRQSELTPIIFITAYGSDELSIENQYAEGAVDFMFAPVNPEALRSKVVALAKLFTRNEMLAAQVAQLESRPDPLRMLMELSPISIFQTDMDGRFVYTNAHWSEVTGVTAGDALGKRWSEIVAADAGATLFADAPNGIERDHSLSVTFSGSPTRAYVVSPSAIPAADGAPEGWIGLLTEVPTKDAAPDLHNLTRNIIYISRLLFASDLDQAQRDHVKALQGSGVTLLAMLDGLVTELSPAAEDGPD